MVVAIAYSSQLTVTNGTLLNAAGGTINALGGAAPGGTRTLAAQLDNQGTLTLSVPLTLARASAAHTNGGTIDLVGGNLTLTQSGTTPSFTNSGTITIGAARTLAVTNGTFTSAVSATLSGAGTLSFNGTTAVFNGATPAVAALATTNSTVTFASALTTTATTFTIVGSTVNGAGPFTNAAGQTLTLVASTLNMPVDNQGTLVASGASAITGALTTTVGSVLRMGQVDGSASLANLTVANGFTNNGAIELTVVVAIAYSSQLTVTSGTLTNASGGSIASLNGAAGGGTRTLAAVVDNQGTITVGPGTAGLLTINGGLTTSGTINLELGGTTVTTQYDRIAVTGSATLGGTLNVALINAFTPATTNTFQVLTTTGTRSGTFAIANLPGSITTPPTYNATNVTLVAP